MRRKMRWPFAAVVLAALALVRGGVEPAVAGSPSVTISAQMVMYSPPVGGLGGWGGPTATGTFEGTGDVDDEGVAYASYVLASWWPFESYWYAWFYGKEGILGVRIHVQTNTWTVCYGSGAYAGATGSGAVSIKWGSSYPVTFTWTLTGSVDM
ncbi:MAG: hypothetical protein ACYS99_15395 [Planctomycetota bacterium]|jgi:hypothetical protein